MKGWSRRFLCLLLSLTLCLELLPTGVLAAGADIHRFGFRDASVLDKR